MNLAPPANLGKVLATRKGDVTPNAGLVYRITKQTTLYGSFATSYAPAAGDAENDAGETGQFRPATGRNYEVGTKFDRIDGKWGGTFSLFETTLDNVLVQSDATQLNVRGNRYFVQTSGSRRTRGAELSLDARPLPGLSVNVAGTYLDARYFGEGRLPGSRAERTPPWAFSSYARYERLNRNKTGWGATLGVIWQDARWSTQRTIAAPDPLLMPSYARFDGSIFARITAHWEVAMNVENLADKTYFYTGATGGALEVGSPRTVSVRITYRH